MNLAVIIADAMQILNIGQLAIKALQDAQPFIDMAKQILEGNAMTSAQRAAALQQEAALTAALDADDPTTSP